MLNIFYKKNSENIIIFIHGFIGGTTTWIKEDGTKPLVDLLLKERRIKEGFDLAIFEYHTKLIDLYPARKIMNTIFGSRTTKKNLPIEDISDLLSSQVKYKCNDYKNIVLIGHSMGGLVAKKFLLDDLNENTISKIKMYVSLATPHLGSDLATFGKLISENVNINDLQPLSDSTRELNDSWVKCNNLPKRVYFQGLHDEIVVKNSSKPIDKDKQNIIYCDHDHFSIIKPSNKDDIVVVALKLELINFLKSEEAKDLHNSERFIDEGQYDKEMFVFKLLLADVHETLIDSSKQAFYHAEFAVRKFQAIGHNVKLLVPLYEKLKDLYVLEFGKLLTSQYADSNALVHAIHDKIFNEDKKSLDILNTLYPALETLHKYGMLHQLSNIDDKIWWAKNNGIKDLEEFKSKLSTLNQN